MQVVNDTHTDRTTTVTLLYLPTFEMHLSSKYVPKIGTVAFNK